MIVLGIGAAVILAAVALLVASWRTTLETESHDAAKVQATGKAEFRAPAESAPRSTPPSSADASLFLDDFKRTEDPSRPDPGKKPVDQGKQQSLESQASKDLATSTPKNGRPGDLKRDGAFGFPQGEAKVLCDTEDLRLSAWNDAEHLYVQAIVWKDGDDTLGETGDGRKIGDTSALCLDVDADQKRTPKVDRDYALNPWPHMPGLHYQVVLSANGWTGLLSDSKGRGAIRYVSSEGRKVRVDSFVVPLAEIGKKPGENLRLAFWGESAKPKLLVNSVGYENQGQYYSYALPHEKYHELTLADRAAALDLKAVPEGRDEARTLPKKEAKAMPRVGALAPEVSAKEWINRDKPPSLTDLRDQVVLVEFWATWCGPCVKGIPHLNGLHEKYGPQGLCILSFTDQSKKAIEEFIEKTPIKYTVGTGSDLADVYGVTAIPQGFLIGKDGKVLWSGHPSDEELEKAIQRALEKK